jgi:hypothetical protein
VTWDFSHLDGLAYCPGTRQFLVAVRSYKTYEAAKADVSLFNGEFDYDDAGRRTTEFNVTGIDFNKFHRFYVKTKLVNGFGSTTAYTPLQHFGEVAQITWEKAVQKISVLEGDPVSLSCVVTGRPEPTLTYTRLNDDHVFETLYFPRVQIDDDGEYVCTACHDRFDNHIGAFKQICRTATITLYVTPRQKGRECLAYTGHQCAEFIHSDWKVFSSNASLITGNHLTAEIATISDEFSAKCFEFIKSVLCHTLLPYCDPFSLDDYVFNPLPICSKTCSELRLQCGDEIERFGGDNLSNKLFKNCMDVDSSGEGPGDKPGCIFIYPDHPSKAGPDVDTLLPEDATFNCVVGNGRSYRGNEHYTSGGALCQRWSSQWPQEHQFTKLMGGELDTASRYCRNPGGLGERPWCFVYDDLDSNFDLRWEYCDIPECGRCVSYDGDFCKPIGYTEATTVLFRENVKDSIADMELELRGALHSVQGDELSPCCERAVLELLCYGALPICVGDTKCQLQCELLDVIHVCPAAVQDMIRSIDYIDLEACEDPDPQHDMPLCPLVTEGSGGVQATDVTEITEMTTETSDTPTYTPTTCYEKSDLGQNYTGGVNITTAHLSCVPWPPVFTRKYPELEGAFCRNPGQLQQGGPWCFTSVEGSRDNWDWEYCNVSICSDTATISSNDSSLTVKLLSFFGTTFILVVIIVVVAIVVCVLKHTKQYRKPAYALPGVTNSVYFTNTVMSPTMWQNTKSFRKIDKSKIKYVRQLGQGNFGVVFQGECDWIEDGYDAGGPTKVAVKTLKQESSREAIEDFIREAKLLHGFDHPHIVEFFGVCMDDMPFYMVFEYMDQGDLCQFLRTHSSSTQRRYNPPIYRERISSSVSTDSATLGATQLLDMCKQIAKGMAYLESKNHIHRDLACRNCLVRTGMIVKIADFGMSQNLYSKDYYRVSGEVSLPVRWMPPESIIYGTFSTKGDVWSFGVVMWEIFSFGMQPYWGYPNDTVVDMLRRGKLLEKPDSCPDKLYSLIKDGCWKTYENERTSFAALDRSLADFRLSDSDISITIDEDMPSDVFDDVDSLASNGNDDDKDD